MISTTKILMVMLCAMCGSQLMAQQTVRGTVIDKDAKSPVPFATVIAMGTDPVLGASCDKEGRFRLENVPIGRQTLKISSLGYEPVVLPNVDVTSGREVVLIVGMTESYQSLDEVIVEAGADKSEAVNELATVSARSLSVEEANRYAAAMNDPARQALNFAGVSSGGDDLLNEIVIRGNSPRGLLWRLEGVEIPNPNHFAELGSSGGGVSMLSSNVLSNSDFFTGAFPAEYGNALSGVFDLKFRNGNNEQRELSLGAGFLGLEVAAEGPFKNGGKSSYLLSYRYSTLGVLTAFGFDIAGDYVPSYQDVSFNVDIPTKGLGTFNAFGLGGNNWVAVEDVYPSEKYIEKTVDYTGILGVKHLLVFSRKAYLQTVASGTYSHYRYSEEIEYNNGTRVTDYETDSKNASLRFSSFFNYKHNARHLVRLGAISSHIQEDLYDGFPSNGRLFTNDLTAKTQMLQAYAQWKWRLTERITLNTGIHYLHLALTDKSNMEPRIGMRWQISGDHAVNVGAGMHTRIESLSTYVTRQIAPDDRVITPNMDLGLSKAAHLVLGYDYNINDHTRLKVEAYYQNLYDIPVSTQSGSTFSSINAFGAFSFLGRSDTLANQGSGKNYGIELTLEQFLHKGMYYLATISLFESEYSMDGKQYFNTRFNNNFIFNLLVGKEFQLKNKAKILGVNAKINISGSRRHTGVDTKASIRERMIIYSETPYNARLEDYWRVDLGLNYKVNRSKTTHILTLNIQNVTNRLNEYGRDYYLDGSSNKILSSRYDQSGLIPVLKYQVNF